MGGFQLVCSLLGMISGVRAAMPIISHTTQLSSHQDPQSLTLKLKHSLTQSQVLAKKGIARRYLSNAMPVTGLDQYYGMRSSDSANLVYIATIQIGSNNKEFTGIIDTSSTDFWVPAAGCSGAGCRTTLGPQDSSTLQINQSNIWNSDYQAITVEEIATGPVEGVIASDNYTIAGLQVNGGVGQFGLATSVNYGATLDVFNLIMSDSQADNSFLTVGLELG
jgi:hypothetical protein